MLSIWYLALSSDSVKGNYSHIVSLQRCRVSKLFWVAHHLDILNHLFMSLPTRTVEGLTSYGCVCTVEGLMSSCDKLLETVIGRKMA